MARDEIRGLAAAIRQHNRRERERRGPSRIRAVVERLSPLQLDPSGLDMALDDEDVTIGDALEQRLAAEPLAVGDTLVLLRLDDEDDDYVAVERLRG